MHVTYSITLFNFIMMFLGDTSSSEFTTFIQIFFFTTLPEFFILVPPIQAVLKSSVFFATCNNHEDTGILAALSESWGGRKNHSAFIIHIISSGWYVTCKSVFTIMNLSILPLAETSPLVLYVITVYVNSSYERDAFLGRHLLNKT